MNSSLPRPAKPDYTSVFKEPAYPGGEPYKRPEYDDEEAAGGAPVRPGADVTDER
ncbi:hypothetical protein AB0O20_19245 [Streptomyces kronopolitis]|uniref:hypothetical protein n=1 Tax=Streptomyces kronopolitis TaxID=1612435 RepID=UPI00341B49C7